MAPTSTNNNQKPSEASYASKKSRVDQKVRLTPFSELPAYIQECLQEALMSKHVNVKVNGQKAMRPETGGKTVPEHGSKTVGHKTVGGKRVPGYGGKAIGGKTVKK